MMQRAAWGDGSGRPVADLVRVLIVDDSPSMRRLIALALSRDRRITVIGEAGNAAEALRAIKLLHPDVLTLDIVMPGMSGLGFLERLMRVQPLPVVMVSFETGSGGAATVAALSLGAVDCVGKPRGYREDGGFPDLAEKLVVASKANLRGAGHRHGAPQPLDAAEKAPANFRWNGNLVLIGASTGGVGAIEQVLRAFPADCPPTVIIQHMPPAFLASLALRLDAAMAPQVALATEGVTLKRGRILIAPGGDTHLSLAPEFWPRCRLLAQDKRNGHRPSVDICFEAALPFARRTVAVLLTGMGQDGAKGMRQLRGAGAHCLAQDQESATVWGMPGAAWKTGAAAELHGVDVIGHRVMALCSRPAPG